MSLATLDATAAAPAHVRRVTLNIVRNASVCPPKLRRVVGKLDRRDWKLDALTKGECEYIFATVGDDLTSAALTEYVANTRSIKDWSREPAGESFCKLCGHQHIRWEFRLDNLKKAEGGKDWLTGSDCIIQYGFNVDGEGTAEAALKALRGAISTAIAHAKGEDWRTEHPDHEADIEVLRDGLAVATRRVPWDRYAHLKDNWKGRAREFAKLARGAVKYHEKHASLTPKRTEDVYGAGKLLQRSKALQKEWAAAEPGKTKAPSGKDWGAHWQGILDEARDNGVWLSRYAFGKLRYLARQGMAEDRLYDDTRKIVKEVEDKIKSAKAAASRPDTGKAKGEGWSDLPF